MIILWKHDLLSFNKNMNIINLLSLCFSPLISNIIIAIVIQSGLITLCLVCEYEVAIVLHC